MDGDGARLRFAGAGSVEAVAVFGPNFINLGAGMVTGGSHLGEPILLGYTVAHDATCRLVGSVSLLDGCASCGFPKAEFHGGRGGCLEKGGGEDGGERN